MKIIEQIAAQKQKIKDAQKEFKRKQATIMMEISRLQMSCKHPRRKRVICPDCGLRKTK